MWPVKEMKEACGWAGWGLHGLCFRATPSGAWRSAEQISGAIGHPGQQLWFPCTPTVSRDRQAAVSICTVQVRSPAESQGSFRSTQAGGHRDREDPGVGPPGAEGWGQQLCLKAGAALVGRGVQRGCMRTHVRACLLLTPPEQRSQR